MKLFEGATVRRIQDPDMKYKFSRNHGGTVYLFKPENYFGQSIGFDLVARIGEIVCLAIDNPAPAVPMPMFPDIIKKAAPCSPGVATNTNSQGMAAPAVPTNLHVKGAKDDNGKVMIDLILDDMPRALLAVAEVATFGAKKYTRGGWLEVPNGINRYRAALQRHMLNENIDEGGRDPETKLHHAAHEAWNALARLELLCREQAAIDKHVHG